MINPSGNSFGPWAAAMHEECECGLSTFWKKRLRFLAQSESQQGRGRVDDSRRGKKNG